MLSVVYEIEGGGGGVGGVAGGNPLQCVLTFGGLTCPPFQLLQLSVITSNNWAMTLYLDWLTKY